MELNPDAILAVGGRVIPILMELTRSIPIVTPGAPTSRAGLRGEPRPPRRQRHRLCHMELSVIGKMLQTLKEIAPDITHVLMIYNPDNPVGALAARAFESAAGPLGVEPTVAHIHGLADIERAVASGGRRSPMAAFLFPWT